MLWKVSSCHTGKGLSAIILLYTIRTYNYLIMQINTLLSSTPPCAEQSMMFFFLMFPQLFGHTCRIFPEETNQLQPPHQSQQSVHHLSRDWWNQSDPPHRLWERPASILAIGASQWGPGQHEQCSRGLWICVWCKFDELFSKLIDFWHNKIVLSSSTDYMQHSKKYLTSLQIYVFYP